MAIDITKPISKVTVDGDDVPLYHNLQSKIESASQSQQTIEPDDGYDGLSQVVIQAATLQNKNVSPTTSEQSIQKDSGYYGLGTVTVEAVTSAIDNNIVAGNIKAGVTILGVTGNVEPDKPDQTKTVTPTTSEQLVEPDTGYELASVTVNPIPSNYKDTTNTTALPGDILAGKVAVNSTGEITGNIQTYSGSTSVNPTTSQQTLSTNGTYVTSDITVNAVDPTTYTDPYNTQLIALNSGGGVEPSILEGTPITATTDNEMSALLVAANDGKIVKFTGTSQTYETDAYYIIEEDSV